MQNINTEYKYAKERYSEIGVDTKKAIEILKNVPLSVHCWQGDDLVGFETKKNELAGGLAVTGNYPGRARTADELRMDYEKAFSLIPGKHRVNLHSFYLESGGKHVDRDSIEIEHFANWMDWAKEQEIALDFNSSMFAHPKAEDGYTLASYDKSIRDFWIEHAKRARNIAEEMGKRQGTPCIINHWMLDGCKEFPVDRYKRRELYIESMDKIISEKKHEDHMLDSIESKLFGIGLESFTAGSNELCFGYALSRNIMLTYDLGHFHPMESVGDKISSALMYLDKLLLHTSRGVRWDSDHVVIQDDNLYQLMQEVVRAQALDRVYIALDFFDASVNRVAAWVVGARATQKALLYALLEPYQMLLDAEISGDTTTRLCICDEMKNMPVNAVWNYYCESCGVPVGMEWVSDIREYEKNYLVNRI